MSRPDRWLIVGGGASGLAAAFFLRQLGRDAVVVERESTLGGRMGTVRLGGRTLDCGGKNIGRQYKLFRQFVASLGTHPLEYFGLNSSQATNGRLKTFDANARWRSMAALTRGASARDVFRFARLLWRVKCDDATGYLGSAYARRLARRFDELPVSQHFTPEFCERIIRPMSVRMNGAEPDEVFMGNLTSNVRMILDTYDQFRDGVAPVLDAFRAGYDVRLNTATEGLRGDGGRVTGLRVRHADGKTAEMHGAGVILATPATIAAKLTQPLLPELSRHLQSIAYYPVTLVIAEYDRPIFSPAVRALVFDKHHAVSNAAAYSVNDLHLVRYTYSGRASRQYISDSTDADALLRVGEAALAKHLPFDPSSRRRISVKRFNPGLCAYTPNHGDCLDAVDRSLTKVPGLYLTGDYMQGASIEACFRAAFACVHRLARPEQSGARNGFLTVH
jgi:protoporphyrinogen/coproporphyrinogen III oxidase